MTEQASLLARGKRGVIGTRQLIAVQTFDIARLTAHPVAIVPGAFVAVTGRGPKDSNESGKTSFLAALALLLGDPEWRMAGGGSVHAPKLLFEPVTAGASPERHGPAHVGYVVGVFAEPDDPQATAHTVWLQISAKPQHIEVRHKEGVHLLLDGDDRERHNQAPDFFRRLGGKPLGATDYAETLYGRAPRLLAYIATRGGIRSRPSLLKLDAGNFTPVQIGDALLSLTGKAGMLSNDVQARKDLAKTQADLANMIARADVSYRAEEAILHSVETRARARVETSRAHGFWRSARARAALDTLVRDRRITAHLTAAEAELDVLARERDSAQTALGEARNTGHLQRIAREALQLKTETEEELAGANRAEGKLRGDLEHAQGEYRRAVQCAENYIGPSPEELAGHVRTQESELIAVGAKLLLAKERAEKLGQELADAREGRTGAAAAVLQLLHAKEMEAVGLMAATRVRTDARHLWEARLAPWQDAVCIPPGTLENATAAVSTLPGAVLVTGPTTPPAAPAPLPQDIQVLPDGILDTDPLAVSFLHALARATQVDNPPHASMPGLGVHIIGGFEQPIAGQEDICAHLQRRLHDVESQHSRLAGAADLHRRRITELRHDIKRAQAHELAQLLGPKVRNLEEALAEHLTTLPTLRATADSAALTAHHARDAFATAKQRAEALADAVQGFKKRLAEAARRKDRLHELQAGWAADRSRATWKGTLEEALDELNWSTLPDDDPDAGPTDETSTQSVLPRDADRPAECRSSIVLEGEGRARLAAALTGLASDTKTTGVATPELAHALQHHEANTADPHGQVFRTSLAALKTWLDDNAERDIGAREQVAIARHKRGDERAFLESVVDESRQALAETQESIQERVHSALDLISKTLNRLDEKDRGYGADLTYDITPPDTAEGQWICQVIPRWRRNPSGPLLPYDAPTNTAQEKLFSIHLVLAALLAAPDARGRVLILDELGDSLGAEHRREVIAALRDAAQEHGITVLATCQDGLMSDVRSMCGQILQFRYYSKSDALNRPTAMFGFDANRQRVRLTLDDLVTSRS
ncbi:hypothetical protein [Streptomyces sp. NBC_00827]|uniref:hypothetical protein n=1 Tax=Streptomyces sp. NBC_00827 TaxID=2903677 RepID=UPI0038672436|nr:hypothetical protein OG569_42795 [Streptomyces sp. NBC_00827]